MSGEIVVPETPNWLQELEAKRERRLKAKLGHETGAGAPCLKCEEKCPGLDLHFWRKCCKICKCPKEEHEVQDDDIYGWAQFQLVGSKPNKIRKKILLPGKKDELDLDWAPKGHNETVDKYLKTLPPEQLPVKGSQAAQDRKQLLQKQIPIHDIDPSLCHDLTEDELKKMNEYIAHVKQSSAGVGQIVSLSSIIKGNLHMLNPAEAAIMANRYAKGIPSSEIVKLHSQSKATSLKQQELSRNMEKLHLNEKTLPHFAPNTFNQTENSLDPLVSNKFHDKNYPSYTNDSFCSQPGAQFVNELDPHKYRTNNHTKSPLDLTIDPKYLQNPNFDYKNRPSQFLPSNVPYNMPYAGQNALSDKNSGVFDSGSSAFVPYQRTTGTLPHGESYVQTNTPLDPSYASNLQSQRGNVFNGKETGDQFMENLNSLHPNYSKTISPGGKYRETGRSFVGRGFQDPYPIRNAGDISGSDQPMENANRTKVSPPVFKYQETGGSLGGCGTQGPISLRKGNTMFGGDQPLENVNPFDPNHPKTISSLYKYPETGASSGENSHQDPYSIHKEKDALGNDIPHDALSGKLNLQQDQGRIYGKDDRFENNNTLNNSPESQVFQSSGQGYPKSNYANTPNIEGIRAEETHGNINSMRNTDKKLPNYAPGSFNTHSVTQSPAKVPKSFRDLAFSTYDPNNTNSNALEDTENEFKLGHYRQPGSYPENNSFSRGEAPKNSNGFRPIQVNSKNDERTSGNQFLPEQGLGYQKGAEEYRPHNIGQISDENNEPLQQNQNQNSNRNRFNNIIGPNKINENSQTLPCSEDFTNPLDKYSSDPYTKHGFNNPNQPGKTLSELHPASLRVDEDFLHPSQVNVGLIKDIDYPEIKAATQGTNDFYEDFSPDSIKEILNNMKLPDCHYCKRPFEEKEFAITIDRANALFHAGCFRCAGCNQILADNMYFYNKESDNIYCLRDYAKIRGFPRCKACDELIFTKEYCLAENSTFHLKHFCCIECDTPLAGKDYTLEEEMPYCLPCFEQSKASKCSSCCRVIKPDEVGCTLNDVHFHANDECFACKVCKKPLMKKKMLLRNQKLYCSHECYGTEK